ncbi:MAG TPA: RNA polymerase sigma factor [Ktedonobacteraceae bacterium]|nr:RNA polymerase sigma factor [Ktedonobacteraceae bacterium]
MQQPVDNDDERQNALAEELFHRHAPALFAFLHRQVSSREDAEDLLLEIFTSILEHQYLARLSPENQRMFIWRIARNKVVDAYRRSARRPAVSLDTLVEELLLDSEQMPENTIERWEASSHLRAVLQTLPPLQQTILRLRFVEELRSAEIASLVGKSEVSVRATISRTLNRLRQLYREGEK